MANDLMTIENKFVVNGEEIKLTGNIVKNYLTHGNEDVSDQEVVMFINLCKYQKLNPFLNEAYLVKFKGSPAQIVVGKEAYMKKAERNDSYEGLKAGLIIQRDNQVIESEGSFALKADIVLGGWAEVYKKNRKFPYIAKVNLEEYNKGQSTWNKFPKTMIRKVAIVQALREAFPEDLGALYTEEEVLPVNTDTLLKEEIKQKGNSKVIDIKQEKVIDVQSKDVKEKTNSTPKVEAEQIKMEDTPY